MFDDSFIENLPDDPLVAGKRICDQIDKYHQGGKSSDINEQYEVYLSALSILKAFAESNGIVLDYPNLESHVQANINSIVEFFETTRHIFDNSYSKSVFDQYKTIFDKKYGENLHYEFPDNDLKRIQTLINELREKITDTDLLEKDHKLRILQRLEKLQVELHKKVSNFDRYLGLMVDGSIILAKVGENAKPIVDRIKEITEIICKIIRVTESLPGNTPLQLTENKQMDKS